MSATHAPHLDLLPVDASGNAPLATHVAVNAGDWFDPGTWSNGQVPGEGAIVHIPAGVSVSYDGASDANLFMVRVDGSLTMTAEDGGATKMVVDTMITSDTSFLHVDAGDAQDGTVDIVFSEGAPAAHQGHFTDVSQGDGVIGRYNWDPEQLSLGLVASGEVKVEGQEVDGSIQLGSGPLAGESTLNFDASAEGIGTWAVGQTIVVGGTDYTHRDADGALVTQDEVRTIVDIQTVNGQVVVTLDEPLDHDHVGPPHPDTGAELTGFVANLSRNVNFSSAAADQDGDGQPGRGVSLGESLGPGEHYVTERGHVMFMHNDNVEVSNSGFLGLGRTDKSTDVQDFELAPGQVHNNRAVVDVDGDGQFDPGLDFEATTAPEDNMNQRARYPVHIHEAGIGDEKHALDHDDDLDSEVESALPTLPGGGVIGPCAETGSPICHCGDADGDGTPDCVDEDHIEAPGGAVLSGNVVWGSPGWGYVQHASEADLLGNVAFDVAGSSFVAELGDEVGRWEDNTAIGTYGARPGEAIEDSDDFNEDDGFQGNGFYLKSRAIDMVDNVAISSARAGFFYHNNGAGMKDSVVSELGDIADAVPGLESMDTENVPITIFDGNKAIAAFEGIRIATDPLDSVRKYNDAYSKFTDFVGYALEESGVSITYSSKYIFSDFLLIGNEDREFDANSTAGFHFKVSVADITVANSHIEGFDHAVFNYTQVGNRQEYRRGYWDPKAPAGNPWVEAYDGLDSEGIDNPVYNLWNNNLIDVSWDNLSGGAIRFPRVSIDNDDGTITKYQGVAIFNTEDNKSINDPDTDQPVEIELIGDSAAGGLVALWREDLANDPNQRAVLANEIPLAYDDDAYLGQVVFENGRMIKRATYGDYVEGINSDIWSGTVLEFSKTDSLGTLVFEYGDFSPMNPSTTERAVTTNERIVFSKEMIDGVLAEDGYYTLPGHDDAKFVELTMIFSDRATGAWVTKTFLVGLDLQWEIPADALNLGTVRAIDGLVIAPEYAFFENGVLVAGRDALTAEEIIEISQENFDLLANTQIQAHAFSQDGGYGVVASAGPGEEPEPEVTDEADDHAEAVAGLGAGEVDESGADAAAHGAETVTTPEIEDETASVAAEDFETLDIGSSAPGDGAESPVGNASGAVIHGADGDDLIEGTGGQDRLVGGRGDDVLSGGAGDDDLRAGHGDDELSGGAGDDKLFGRLGNDRLDGGAGDDDLKGGTGDDELFGGAGNDVLTGGRGRDSLDGGDGDDVLGGGRGEDFLSGGAGNDRLEGGGRGDRLFGGDGNDRLDGGAGNDELTGGEGADSFVFENNSGVDVITDFEDGVDAIEFMIQSFGFDDLSIFQQGDDAVVEHEGGKIVLQNTDASDLDQSDFQFLSSG